LAAAAPQAVMEEHDSSNSIGDDLEVLGEVDGEGL
jgi:hypothetical protein